MGIQRYTASLDTTITNAYKMNLTTRGTGSNMGLADTLEVFSIYGQASSASSELSRILIQFPVEDIATDRTDGTIPASGSVNFFLRMYNAEHSFTVPKDFSLNISAISRSWEEGYGLDMDEYTDLTYDDVGSNWIRARSGSVAAFGKLIVADGDLNTSGQFTEGEYVIIKSTDGTVKYYVLCDGSETGAPATGAILEYGSDTGSGSLQANITALTGTYGSGSFVAVQNNLNTHQQALILNEIKAAINHANGHNAGSANSVISLSDDVSVADGEQTITLTQVTEGSAGNNTIVTNISQLSTVGFVGGGHEWTTAGGDYYFDTSSSFTASFADGTEDVEADITELVEQWLTSSNLGSKTNYGVGIMFPSAQETAVRSYYTKKFFARGSQYYLKRPVIEARWDSSEKDDASNFYLSSSLATAAENLNTIYLYNNVRGQLRDIPYVGTGGILVSIYSGSVQNNAPSGSKIGLAAGGDVATAGDFNITGGHVGTTGIYTASFAYTSSAITTIFPVWHSHSVDNDVTTEYHTGSAIVVKTLESTDYNPHADYVTKITNLRDSYTRDEKITRFRLYVRERDWNPNIYTKATSNLTGTIVEDAYYRIYRTVDEFEVLAYGTGSTNHTRLSYDASGSYFDFPMDILEAGYMYAFRFIYKMPDGNYREQPEIFKFRVD